MTSAAAPADGYGQRIRLAELLCEAAELEHGLLCQYLYASFSMKRSVQEGVSWEQLESMRQWGASLLVVARQEMEHLGLVCNLLTAIGEAPYLARPNLPLPARAYPMGIASRLEPFRLDALRRFVLFEMPTELTADEEATVRRIAPGVPHRPAGSIEALYDEIAALFTALDGPGLFIGPPSAQLANAQMLPFPIRGIQLPPGPLYDVLLVPVSDNPSAQAVIARIVQEGEGAPAGSSTSHFARFCTMYEELDVAQRADPAFVPARPLVDDPRRAGIELATTEAVVGMFDLAYETLMLLLVRFFAQSDETGAEIAALQKAAFFPMMSGVVRPLGEIVTQLPVSAGGPRTAGPRFDYTRSIALLPHKTSAWQTIHARLAYLAGQARDRADDPALPDPARPRLALVAQNLTRIAADFAAGMGLAT